MEVVARPTLTPQDQTLSYTENELPTLFSRAFHAEIISNSLHFGSHAGRQRPENVGGVVVVIRLRAIYRVSVRLCCRAGSGLCAVYGSPDVIYPDVAALASRTRCWTYSHHCQIADKNPSKRWNGEFWGFRICVGWISTTRFCVVGFDVPD